MAPKTSRRAEQLSLMDLGPARQPARPDFWAREREDREDHGDVPRDDAEQE